ncbi:MAG: 16S rRNA (cytidine(1402)-2'-O)-methyltransferase [Vicinamibacterales bacterium]
MSGTLFVVATPIGNLEDITLRALRVLREVALVAAEDTRRTGNLLRHYDIHTPILSVHEHNERVRAPKLISRLLAGDSIALVTDAGTPGISDPGAQLVAAVRTAGIRVEPIPGPSAVIAAMSAAGIESNGFAFMGFAPIKSKDRKQWFKSLVERSKDQAMVFFEAPHRLLKTLQELSLLVERPILIARELTKLHEELVMGSPVELIKVFDQPIGEFTLILPPGESVGLAEKDVSDQSIADCFGQITETGGAGTKRDSARLVAEQLHLSTKQVYDALERVKLGELKKDQPSRG